MIWIGAALIVIASTLAGWEISKRLERRTVLLRHMNVALETLDTEVAFALMPLSAVFEQISRQLPAPVSQFFYQVAHRLSSHEESAAEAWQTVLEQWNQEVDLDDKDSEILGQFGRTLGTQDLDGQRKQIQLARSYLSNMEKAAAEAQKTYQSMYRSLGLLGGLLIVIILI